MGKTRTRTSSYKTLQVITLFLLILVTLLFISDSLSLLLRRPKPSASSNHVTASRSDEASPTTLKHIVFGIGSSAEQWDGRKAYVKFWWRPQRTRGFVWLDKEVGNETGYPAPRVSEDTNPWGTRSGLRMARIVSEMARMGLEDVRWFVMGDDDTVFFPENLARVLNKYDHTQMYYVGSNSETHWQNIEFSYGMAFGGGGFAISYPLALQLHKMQDRCMQNYGSDDRIHACMAELGVPLTLQPGFHQFDVVGNVFGMLSAHPVAPLVSLHHLDAVEPMFPSRTRQQSLQKLGEVAALDSAALMQQSICYDNSRNWTVSVSWGYAVQIIRGRLLPTEMAKPARTFSDWYGDDQETAFEFNTRPYIRHPCQKPFVYYLLDARAHGGASTCSRYVLHNETQPWCWWETASLPSDLVHVEVYKKRNPRMWDKAPRRNCCRVLPSTKDDNTLEIEVATCEQGQVIEATWT